MPSWATLFERGDDYDVTVEQVRETLAAVRENGGEPAGADDGRE